MSSSIQTINEVKNRYNGSILPRKNYFSPYHPLLIASQWDWGTSNKMQK
jgi:hypothetical protein